MTEPVQVAGGKRGLGRVRRCRRWIGFVVLLAIALVGAVGAVQLVRAHSRLQAAETDLNQATAAARGGAGFANAATRSATKTELRAAHADFAAAGGDLWLAGPFLPHLSWIPRFGPQLAAAQPLSQAGAASTEATLDILRGLQPAWPVLTHHPRTAQPLLARLAPVLGRGAPWFGLAARQMQGAIDAMHGVPSNLGDGSLDRKVAHARGALPGLESAAQWLSLAPELLGSKSPARYLLVWENPDELRATGGFIPSANLITIDGGRIHTDPYGAWLPHQIAFPSPAPEALYTSESGLYFEDSNWSPDFPLSARYERWFFGEDTGQWAPFVIDVSGPGLLQATGPLRIPRYGVTVTEANVGRYIEYFHHLKKRGKTDTQSQEFLASLATTLLNHIEGLGPRGFVTLGSGLHQSISAQQILMYSGSQAEEAAITASGADGRILDPPNDSLMVVDDNRSYNKINPYIGESATYQVDINSYAQATATLTLTYHVRHSPATLQGAGPYFGFWYTKHDYQDFIRVYVPPGASLTSESGAVQWAPMKAYGLTQLAGRILLLEGQTRRVVFRYRVPSAVFHASGTGRYVLTIQRQPGGDLQHVRVTVNVDPGMSVGSHAARSMSSSLTLNGTQTVFSVPISGINASVPPLTRTFVASDPFLPMSYFAGYRHHL